MEPSIPLSKSQEFAVAESTFQSNKNGAPTESPNDFQTLIELLDPQKKQEVMLAIAALTNCDKIFGQIEELARTHGYQAYSELFTSPQFEYYALAAVNQGILTAMQFATMMHVRAGLTDKVTLSDIEIVCLFVDNAPNVQAWNIIKKTFEDKRYYRYLPDDVTLAKFFDAMRALPDSEQAFVILPDTRDRNDDNSNVSVTLNRQGDFDLFCTVAEKRMIPSYGMIQALLTIIGGDDLTFKFVLGASTPDSIRRSMRYENAREICVHCSEIAPAPSLADGNPSPPIDFIYHDLYHLILCKHIPKKIRDFFLDVALLFHPDRGTCKDPTDREIYASFYEALVDVEMRNFALISAKSKSQLDDLTIKALNGGAIYAGAKGRLLYKMIKTTPLVDEIQTKLSALLTIWHLYKREYQNIEEIERYYEALSPQVQKEMGAAYKELLTSDLLSQEDCAGLLPEELSLALALFKPYPYAASTFGRTGISVKQIWALDSELRKLFIRNAYVITSLIQDHGVSLETLVKAGPKIMKLLLTGEYTSIQVCECLRHGATFDQLTTFAQKLTPSKDTFTAFNIAKEMVMGGRFAECVSLDPSQLKFLVIHYDDMQYLAKKKNIPLASLILCKQEEMKYGIGLAEVYEL